jgi:hypothetical protein
MIRFVILEPYSGTHVKQIENPEIVYKSMEAMLSLCYVVDISFDTVLSVFTDVPYCL